MGGLTQDNVGTGQVRRVGHPTILEQYGITEERIVSLYAELKTVEAVAARLGVTSRTIRKYLHKNGVRPIGPRPTAKSWLSKRPSPVYQWFRKCAEQGRPIPRNMAAIAELSGCSKPQVQYFLDSRRKAAKRYLHALGGVPAHGILEDTLGRKVQLAAVSQHEIKVDTYDMTVRITALLRTGVAVVIQVPFAIYVDLLKRYPPEGVPREGR